MMRAIGVTGWSGAGKTTLLTRLIPALTARGLKVSTLKHAHHAFDVDVPGKDSYEHRMAGASEVLTASGMRFALMHELRGEPELRLHELLAKFSKVDLVLIEGFKTELHDKIEVFRAANAKPPLHVDDPHIRLIASDIAFPDAGRPVVDLDDVAAIAQHVIELAEPIDQLMARLKNTPSSSQAQPAKKG